MTGKNFWVNLLSVGALSLVNLLGAPLSPDLKQEFQVEQPSKVPGATLSPGTYSIGILDYMADRSILQVKDSSGKVLSTFIGIRRSSAPQGTNSGMNLWGGSAASESAYRAWVLPKGQGALEFAYPKADAVAIAKVSGAPVPAIDPESEGKAPAGSLSKDDMQVINLWLLSSSTVNPQTGEAAIQVSRFRTEGQPLAKALPVAQHLPHSASNLPLIGLAGLSALGAAILLAVSRKALRA